MSDSILTIEHNFFMICTFSLLLLTTSIVFFQMAQSRKDLPYFYSSFFSICLVGISFIYTGMSLFQYHERMKRKTKNGETSNTEKIYWYFYLILGILFMIVEIFICFVLVGKIEHWKVLRIKKNKK